MIIKSSADERWLTNTYLVAARPGGDALFIDAGGALAPLMEEVRRQSLIPVSAFITHRHDDHIEQINDLCRTYPGIAVFAHVDEQPFIPVVTQPIHGGKRVPVGELVVEAMHTPGHTSGSMSYRVDGQVFTGDTLYRGSVGAIRSPGHSTFADIRASVMKLLSLPSETIVQPGHCDSTTVRAEVDRNPFARVWNGAANPGDEQCIIGAEDATLMVWADDYDGGHKAWVRFADGRDDIVPGSIVVRRSAHS